MLKIFIHIYLNRIQSSSLLEKESHSNVDLMRLLERLSRDFKTTANFRKDKSKGIKMSAAGVAIPATQYV
jgi:transposase